MLVVTFYVGESLDVSLVSSRWGWAFCVDIEKTKIEHTPELKKQKGNVRPPAACRRRLPTAAACCRRPAAAARRRCQSSEKTQKTCKHALIRQLID